MTSKYRNRITHVDGYKFDSVAESVRYGELKLLERAGLISGLKVHPEYELLPPFKDRAGKYERAIKYKADFAYVERGQVVVEDVKSAATRGARDWSLRRKLFKHRYPDVELREVAA